MESEPYSPSPIGNPSVLARRNWWQTKLVLLIGRYTPKCNEMVRILSKSMDEPMPLSMRIKKRFHFLICCWCQRYEEQLHYLRGVSRCFPEHADEAEATPVSSAAKERWKNALRTTPAVATTPDLDAELTRRPENFGVAPPTSHSSWSPWNLPLIAMAVLLLLFGLRYVWSPPSNRSLADFRDEMVSFIKVPPNLELRSSSMSDVSNWLKNSSGPSNIVIPQRVQSDTPVGCRVLRYAGHNVTLVCFRRAEGGLIHLFVIDGAVIKGLRDRSRADIAQQGEWITAAWSEANNEYLLAVQGDRAAIERLLTDQ